MASDRHGSGHLPWVEAKTGLMLAPSQAEALRLAVETKVLLITGGPGVGKTTLVNSILKVLQAKGVDVAVCAPTRRADKRLTESAGLDARIIHRLLEADPRPAGSSAERGVRSTATCSWWTRLAWLDRVGVWRARYHPQPLCDRYGVGDWNIIMRIRGDRASSVAASCKF